MYNNNNNIHEVQIFTDSNRTIQSHQQLKPKMLIVTKIEQYIIEHPELKIKVILLKGYSRITGNNRPDNLADIKWYQAII